jgi:hypothetical protein
LDFQIEAPFTLQVEGQSIKCLAFLPDFGGPNGMLVGATLPPTFETDPRLIELAKRRGLYLSFVNPLGWNSFHEDAAKEALTDWGFFGPSSRRPSWLLKAK